MKKFMTFIGLVGMILLGFGFMMCLFIDLPKIWVIIPLIMMASFMITDHFEEEES